MLGKPIILIALLVFAVVLGGLATGPAVTQEGPMTEEQPPPAPDTTITAPMPQGGLAQAEAAGRRWDLFEWFSRGGVFMWPLSILALIAALFMVERTYTLFKARTNSRTLMSDILSTVRRDGVSAAERVCEQTRGPIAAIIHSGLRQVRNGPDAVEKAIETAGAVEMSFLERGLIWLGTISTVAPLLGFLGTVSGMIRAFDAIAAADQVSAKLVAGGISEALITTEAGLIVAIPVSLAHNFFLSMIDRFVVEMEESSSELVNTISELG